MFKSNVFCGKLLFVLALALGIGCTTNSIKGLPDSEVYTNNESSWKQSLDSLKSKCEYGELQKIAMCLPSMQGERPTDDVRMYALKQLPKFDLWPVAEYCLRRNADGTYSLDKAENDSIQKAAIDMIGSDISRISVVYGIVEAYGKGTYQLAFDLGKKGAPREKFSKRSVIEKLLATWAKDNPKLLAQIITDHLKNPEESLELKSRSEEKDFNQILPVCAKLFNELTPESYEAFDFLISAYWANPKLSFAETCMFFLSKINDKSLANEIIWNLIEKDGYENISEVVTAYCEYDKSYPEWFVTKTREKEPDALKYLVCKEKTLGNSLLDDAMVQRAIVELCHAAGDIESAISGLKLINDLNVRSSVAYELWQSKSFKFNDKVRLLSYMQKSEANRAVAENLSRCSEIPSFNNWFCRNQHLFDDVAKSKLVCVRMHHIDPAKDVNDFVGLLDIGCRLVEDKEIQNCINNAQWSYVELAYLVSKIDSKYKWLVLSTATPTIEKVDGFEKVVSVLDTKLRERYLASYLSRQIAAVEGMEKLKYLELAPKEQRGKYITDMSTLVNSAKSVDDYVRMISIMGTKSEIVAKARLFIDNKSSGKELLVFSRQSKADDDRKTAENLIAKMVDDANKKIAESIRTAEKNKIKALAEEELKRNFANSVSIKEIVAELDENTFEKKWNKLKVQKSFDDHFKGKKVYWEGVVEEIGKHDEVLEEVTVTLCVPELKHVRILVRFSRKNSAALVEHGIGDTVKFCARVDEYTIYNIVHREFIIRLNGGKLL